MLHFLACFTNEFCVKRRKGAPHEPNQNSSYPISSRRRRRTAPCICIRPRWDSPPSPAQETEERWTELRLANAAQDCLVYLQKDCHPRITHCDVESSNILLDEKFV